MTATSVWLRFRPSCFYCGHGKLFSRSSYRRIFFYGYMWKWFHCQEMAAIKNTIVLLHMHLIYLAHFNSDLWLASMISTHLDVESICCAIQNHNFRLQTRSSLFCDKRIICVPLWQQCSRLSVSDFTFSISSQKGAMNKCGLLIKLALSNIWVPPWSCRLGNDSEASCVFLSNGSSY